MSFQGPNAALAAPFNTTVDELTPLVRTTSVDNLWNSKSSSRTRSVPCGSFTNPESVFNQSPENLIPLDHDRHHQSAPSVRRASCSSSTGASSDTAIEEAVPPWSKEHPVTEQGSISVASSNDIGWLADDCRSTTTAASAPSLNEPPRARFWCIISGILLAYFIACFDGTITASSHPIITSYFNASTSAPWLSTAFLLTSCAFQPSLGRLSDSLGRKMPYVVSIAIFASATMWCALAGSMTSLILARAACGLGAGGMMTLASIIVGDLVPIEDRGIYQSYINVVYGLGSALGAALGGAMADRLGWRWVFGIQVPPLVFCWAIALVAVPGDLGLTGKQMTVKEEWRVFDARGSVVLTVAMTSLLLGLNLGGTVLPWSHPVVLTALVILAVSLPTFLYVESRASRPIMPLSLIKSSPRANLIFSNFLAAALGSATLFNIPLFFQAVLLNSATSSGLRLVFFSIISSVVGAATGFLVTSTKRLKWPVVTGALCFLLGTALLCLLQSGWPTWMYVLWLVPSAMGQGFQFAGCFVAVLAASPQHDQAVVTSTLILWRSLGMVIGVASSSLVLQNSLLIYLEKNVKGPQKAEVIRRVRTSIESIATLRGTYRYQVADSYNEAIRATFLCCTVLALVSVLLVVPIKLPRLGSRK